MTREQTIGTAELAVHLGRAFPALSAYSAGSLAADLEKLERAARRDGERTCSESDYDSEAGGRRLDRQAARWLVRLSELASLAAPAPLRIRWIEAPPASEQLADPPDCVTGHLDAAQAAGVSLKFQGDPRGCCLLLTLPGHKEALRV